MTLTAAIIRTVSANYEGCTDSSSEDPGPNPGPGDTGNCPDTPRYFASPFFSVHFFSKHYFTVCKPGS